MFWSPPEPAWLRKNEYQSKQSSEKNRFCQTMFPALSMVGFAPSGSYWSPLVSKPLFCLDELGPFFGFQNIDFAKPCLLNSPWSVLPLRVYIQARWSWNSHFRWVMDVFGFQKIDFVKPCLLNSPRSVLPLRVYVKARWSWNAYLRWVKAVLSFQNIDPID